jgi:hypothetical protein
VKHLLPHPFLGSHIKGNRKQMEYHAPSKSHGQGHLQKMLSVFSRQWI